MRFLDLTPAQCHAMTRIVGWSSDGPSIGTLEESLPSTLLTAIVELERLGLARAVTGWRGSRWWHLTERGHAVRDEGAG